MIVNWTMEISLPKFLVIFQIFWKVHQLTVFGADVAFQVDHLPFFQSHDHVVFPEVFLKKANEKSAHFF